MPEPLIGRTLGQYEITRYLETGGMAQIYVATQTSMNREVAIKIVSSDLAHDKAIIARFRREASLIAKLQHPHILPVIDFGQEGQIAYIVMRLVQGSNLSERLKEGPLTVKQTAELLREIGGALEYAHRQGIIHRDLKPANILLDEHDNAYLTDFGIAKAITGDETQSLTKTQGLLGTPRYMAPEQWRGDPSDARTDIYSLGVVVYEMLTGNIPFSADTPHALMFQHINEMPTPMRELRDVPEEVELVVMRALAKDPAARFPTARAMVEAMNSALSEDTTQFSTRPSVDTERTFLPGDMDTAATNIIDTSDIHEPADATQAGETIDSPTLTGLSPEHSRLLIGVGGLVVALLVIIAGLAIWNQIDSGDDQASNGDRAAQTTNLTILTERIDVLAAPDDGAEIIGLAVRDNEFQVTGINPAGDWYQILFVGQFGWVPADAVRIENAGGIPVVQASTLTQPANDATTTSPNDATEAPAPTAVALVDVIVETFDSIGLLNWDRNEANRYLLEGQYHTVALSGEAGSGISLAQGMPPVSDFRLEIDMGNRSKAESQVIAAVLFRVQNTANYYRFSVTSDGQAALIKRVNDEDIPLPFTTIYNWDDNLPSHRLKIEMVDDEMVLYVDDRVVLRQVDKDIPEAGGVGLVAFREGAHIVWDNLRIEPITHLSDPLALETRTYSDDFSTNECQWTDYANQVIAYLDDGAYHMAVPAEDTGLQVRCATLGLFQNMRVEARVVDESQDVAAYGFVFRQSNDGENYYRFVIGNNGQAIIQKQLADNADCQPCNLGIQPLPGFDRNTSHVLAVEAFQDTIRGYVDGEAVIEVQDDAITEPGVVRLGAYQPGARVAFDDLTVRPIDGLTEPVDGLPSIVNQIVEDVTPRLIYRAESNIAVSIPANAESPAMLAELPITPSPADFVFAATLQLETTGENDQCGLVFRATLPDAYDWLNLTRSGFIVYGDAANNPTRPIFAGRLPQSDSTESVDIILIVQDDQLQVALNGDVVDSVIVDGQNTAFEGTLPDANLTGNMYVWVYLSANHASTCRYEDVRVWALE